MSYSPFPPAVPPASTAAALLQTIAELERHLAAARQQLAFELQQLHWAPSGTPPVPAPAPAPVSSSAPPPYYSRGRIPYHPPSASIRLQGNGYSSPHTQPPTYPSFTRKQGQKRHQQGQQEQQGQQQPQGQQQVQRRKPEDLISVPLSSVLRESEEVSFRIILRKDEAGQPVHAVLVARFDGEKLVVSQSEHVPSLVGMTSVKPGEILYRFMEGLKEVGLLKRSFTVAPWRLCSVVREEGEVTLEGLRQKFLEGQGQRQDQCQAEA